MDRRIYRDLETIVLKAIAKERSRRYVSVRAPQRFLDHKPVRACRVSRTERTWRLAKRNPTSILLTLALVLTLAIAGPLIAIRQMLLVRDKKVLNYVLAINFGGQALNQGDLVRMRELLDSCLYNNGGFIEEGVRQGIDHRNDRSQ